MATTDLMIRRADPADTDRILELVRVSLGEGVIPRHRAYWEWKHQHNPFGTSPILLAEAEDRLVGLRAFMRWRWQAGREAVPSVRAVDTATHPEWQGKGIFSRLTKLLVQEVTDEGVKLIFNTPNEKSRPGYLKMGWESLGRVDLWIRPLRPLSALRRLLSGTPSSDAPPEPPGGPAGLKELLASADLHRFCERHSEEIQTDSLHTPLSPEFLDWRYRAVPGFRYGALADFSQGDGAAFVFRAKRQGKLAELRITHVLAGRSAQGRRAARSLLRELCETPGFDYISTMAPPGSGRFLVGTGFLPAPRLGPILTVRTLSPFTSGLDPLARRSWAPAIGDLELF
jgi:GNAT superfamily N-acetyltransferase